jgi:hypothetical protein
MDAVRAAGAPDAVAERPRAGVSKAERSVHFSAAALLAAEVLPSPRPPSPEPLKEPPRPPAIPAPPPPRRVPTLLSSVLRESPAASVALVRMLDSTDAEVRHHTTYVLAHCPELS